MACNCYNIQNLSAIQSFAPLGIDCWLNSFPSVPPSSTIQVCSNSTPGVAPGTPLVVTLVGDCSLCAVTPPQIVCGSGITQNNYYYTDCCGTFVVGNTPNQIVTLNYTQSNAGITLLNVPATPDCPSQTPTQTQTLTATPTKTSTQTPTPTITPTLTPTVTPTKTVTPTPGLSPTATPTNTPTNSATPTNTPTITPTKTVTPTPGLSPSVTPTLTPTKTVTPTPGLSPSVTPTLTPTKTVTPTITPTKSVTPTPGLSPSVTPTRTMTPTPTRTPRPTQCPTDPVFVNDCEITTLFDMGVSCNVIKQPTAGSFDGVLSVNVTGGTPPYQFYWNTGERTQTISNLTYGSYAVLVVDYWGDYSSTTVCSLVAPTPSVTKSPTPTVTPTPTLDLPNLCLLFQVPGSTSSSGLQTGSPQQLQLNFIPSGSQNGKPRWFNSSQGLTIYWNNSVTPNRWQITPWTYGGTPISTNQGLIPSSGWSFIGTPGTYTVISSTTGSCPAVSPLSYTYQVTNATCVGNCNGSIIVSPVGGVPPYSYSLDGVTYQLSNIFSNLCPSTVGLVVKDSVGTTFNQSVTITANNTQNFTMSLNILSSQVINANLQEIKWQAVISPPLPVGVGFIGDVTLNVFQTKQGPFASNNPDATMSIIATNEVALNGGVQLLTTSTPVTQSIVSSCNSSQISAFRTQYTQTAPNIILLNLNNNNYILTGTSTSFIDMLNPQQQFNCVSQGAQSITIQLTNFRPLNNPCVSLQTNREPIGIFNHIVQGQVSDPNMVVKWQIDPLLNIKNDGNFAVAGTLCTGTTDPTCIQNIRFTAVPPYPTLTNNFAELVRTFVPPTQYTLPISRYNANFQVTQEGFQKVRVVITKNGVEVGQAFVYDYFYLNTLYYVPVIFSSPQNFNEAGVSYKIYYTI